MIGVRDSGRAVTIYGLLVLCLAAHTAQNQQHARGDDHGAAVYDLIQLSERGGLPKTFIDAGCVLLRKKVDLHPRSRRPEC